MPEKAKFSAVTALCKNQNGSLVGDKFPRDVLDSDTIEVTFKHRVRGEKWGFQRTDVLKQFPFPVVPNSKFISESVVWFALSRKYKTRYVNEALRVYHVDDGAADHLSTLTPAVLSGRAHLHRFVLNELINWLYRAPRSPCFVPRLTSAATHSDWEQARGPNSRSCIRQPPES
jgi:hypothetical protein